MSISITWEQQSPSCSDYSVLLVCMHAEYRTDNAIKNHWNSTMRRKNEADWNKQLIPMNNYHTLSCIPLARPRALPSAVSHQRTELFDSLPAPTFV